MPEDLQRRLGEILRGAGVSREFGRRPDAGSRPSPEDRLRSLREFRLRPREIRTFLDRFVIKQDEAKKVLSVALCDHYNHVRRCLEDAAHRDRDYAKHNIILLGPTGVGKTYLVRCAARLIGVPFVKADATKFSETGYVGHDVEDLVRDLVRAADGDPEWAGYGIIYLDEIDKIASAPVASGRDVSGRGVQVNLLKLMEETDVSLLSPTDVVGQIQAAMDLPRGRSSPRTLSTRHILFIVSGAFDRLGDAVRKRLESVAIGFGQASAPPRSESDWLSLARTRDFVDYGFEPEFIGRLPVRIVCEPLTAADLESILLQSEGSVLRQYRDDFDAYGIRFSVSREAVTEIARRAEAERTGARGLLTVLERTLRDFKFELPSTGVRAFEVVPATLESPAEAMRGLLRKRARAAPIAGREDLAAFAGRFEADTGFRLTFTRAAAQALAARSETTGRPLRAVCDERFADLRHGLTLIAKRTGETSFRVTRRLVEEPARELARRVAACFRGSAAPGEAP